MPAEVWRVWIVAFAAGCFVALLLGCERPATGGATPAEVRIGYFANLTHAQAVLGVASGDFARAISPAKLTTRVFNAGPSLIEALFAGEIDIGYIGPSPAINGYQKSKREGLKIISGAAANGVGIVARANSGIQKLEDLKGMRIATPQLGNTQDVAARHFVMHNLGQPNADNVIPISNAEQLGLMQRGQIDAAWAPEPWAARLVVEAGGRLLAEEKDLWEQKRFTLTVVIASPDFLKRQPELARKLLRTHQVWTARLASDPEATLPLLGRALYELTGKTIPPEAFRAACFRTEFTDQPLAETLQTFAGWSYDLGFAKEQPDLEGLVDTTLLDAARNE
jgi:NitT/TauT family transport system substrate-binding protein